jgi:hypothetical protein
MMQYSPNRINVFRFFCTIENKSGQGAKVKSGDRVEPTTTEEKGYCQN